MKARIVIVLIIASIFFQACSRAISPYQAANNPKGKHCKDIK